MQTIGFSTGAIALGDFRRALAELAPYNLNAVELSALRDHELRPLMAAIPTLDLRGYEYVSVHAPSKFGMLSEADVVQQLQPAIEAAWPIIVHPDVLHSFDSWRGLGNLLCVENMDGRKPIGRTVAELDSIFNELPEASFCFDIGHAYQIDSSLGLALDLLHAFSGRLREIHFSFVAQDFSHHRVDKEIATQFAKVVTLIPASVPVILETPAVGSEIALELATVIGILPPRRRGVA
jgi:hypothetical protein